MRTLVDLHPLSSERLLRPLTPGLALFLGLMGCQPIVEDLPPSGKSSIEETHSPQDSAQDTGTEDTAVQDTAVQDTASDDSVPCEAPVYDPEPFADQVESFIPGLGAGFGQEGYPDIVLGPPNGGGAGTGSLDVLSLGLGGEIVLKFTDYLLRDGPGVDLLVFENAFPSWPELGIVSASLNGTDWVSWPCEATNSEQGFPGCAGVQAVLSHPENCIDATDPGLAGGDGFDLSELGLEYARFIKIVDAGVNPSGGFDLDAVSIVHGTLEETPGR
ncbi:MAG: cell surface protein [Myxococcota bacterium]|nr:cell surface protein [Myxococcota bacterium]